MSAPVLDDARKRKLRRDAKPEWVDWSKMHGDGCSYHPKCLTCPFETCRYDAARGNAWLAQQRRLQARDLRDGGMDAAGIGKVIGISTRTVHRLLAS